MPHFNSPCPQIFRACELALTLWHYLAMLSWPYTHQWMIIKP